MNHSGSQQQEPSNLQVTFSSNRHHSSLISTTVDEAIEVHHDLSLAETGRVGSNSCASSTCSTTSAEDEPRKGKALRHRDRHRRVSLQTPQHIECHVLPDTRLDEVEAIEPEHDVSSTFFLKTFPRLKLFYVRSI